MRRAKTWKWCPVQASQASHTPWPAAARNAGRQADWPATEATTGGVQPPARRRLTTTTQVSPANACQATHGCPSVSMAAAGRVSEAGVAATVSASAPVQAPHDEAVVETLAPGHETLIAKHGHGGILDCGTGSP